MEDKKKIYITSLHLQHGGVEMAITLLANALVKKGYDVEILCIYNLGQPVYSLNPDVAVSYLTKVRPNRREFFDSVKRREIAGIIREGIKACRVLYLKKYMMIKAIRSIQEGTIISTRNEHSVILSRYGRDKVNKIAQLHHDHNFNSRLFRDFRRQYNNIDSFVLLTEIFKSEIEEVMMDNHHTKLKVIPNFLADMPAAYPNSKKNQVIAVGRLHKVKGFERMLKIWKLISEKRDIILKIIGDGEERDVLEHEIKNMGLQEKVVLTGALEHDKVMEEMRQSLIYLMTSRSEALSFVLIEALAAGLPIVAYDVRVAPRVIIQDGVNGYLIPDGDEAAFTERVEELLNDEEIRAKMEIESKRVSEKYMEKNVIEKWLEIL